MVKNKFEIWNNGLSSKKVQEGGTRRQKTDEVEEGITINE